MQGEGGWKAFLKGGVRELEVDGFHFVEDRVIVVSSDCE